MRPRLRSPIRSEEVLRGLLDGVAAVELDRRFGNTDLIRAMGFLDMAGPMTVVTPWELEDEHGVRRINASGYSALPFGDGYPELLEFVRAYLDENRDVSLPLQSASRWRAALAHNLIALLAEFAPSHRDSEVHLASSGSEAVENAIKFVRASRPAARYLVNFHGAYHGHTLMALSLTPSHSYQDSFKPLAGDVVTLPFGEIETLVHAIEGLGAENVAAVVLEPIQGEGGVVLPPDGYLAAVGELCRRHEILVVADEIQTGLGRAGHWFESLAQGLEPDIITLGKHLSGGIAPIGVTIARRKLCQRAVGGLACDRMAGTYSGNSLSAAIALKSLEILVDHDLPSRARALGERGRRRLREIAGAAPELIEEVRSAGMLFALQLRPIFGADGHHRGGESIDELTTVLGMSALHKGGVEANMALNAKRVVRLSPALTMPEELFDEMWDRVERTARRNNPSWRLLMHTAPRTLAGVADLARTTPK